MSYHVAYIGVFSRKNGVIESIQHLKTAIIYDIVATQHQRNLQVFIRHRHPLLKREKKDEEPCFNLFLKLFELIQCRYSINYYY